MSSLSYSDADIIIAGGGLAAIFTGYEILRQARDAGKDFNVLILADKLNTPCSAGSHAVFELEGMFDSRADSACDLAAILRKSLEKIETTLATENIQCRYKKGYEIKSRTREDLEYLISAMEANRIYKRREIKWNSGVQKFNLPDHLYSAKLDCIGQINMPQMISGLVKAYRKLGGRLIEGIRYNSHRKCPRGGYIIETTIGEFRSTLKPLMATGACHQQTLPNFHFETEAVYTMCYVIGPLSNDEAKKISNGPMAFCNTELDGDVLWGGLDEKNYLTIGRGGITNPTDEKRHNLEKNILSQIEKMYPHIAGKYKAEISFGPMLVAANRMPIVGRMKDYDIAGGWAGMGIVAGYAAAMSYAQWIINENDENLQVFESLQPGFFLTQNSLGFTGPFPIQSGFQSINLD